jgi:lysylphosphatidylglycerol synthetase-like protein (DUF2156 family)
MTVTVSSAATLQTLLQHLEAQRASAVRLLQNQNQLLSGLCVRASRPLAAVRQQAALPPARKGQVISLFEYNRAHEQAPLQAAPVQSGCVSFQETDVAARQQYGEVVDRLLAKYGADDALAVNRKHLAGTLLLSADLSALFFYKAHAGVMFVVCYVGPDEQFAKALEELQGYASSQQLQINMMAHATRVEALRKAGFSTTPLGIWQRIDPLSGFTLDGQKMRRLRYLVQKYTQAAECRTREYRPGSDAATDEAICATMERWVELKATRPPFVDEVQRQVRAGELGEEHRFFLTTRNGQLDNIMVFSRDNLNDGYLMDLEFYGKDMPLGSTEFALVRIIECFAAENRRLLSLGLTMGTGLFEHENGSPEVHKLFEQLRKADYLNGDANAQYKNKYRPQTTTMYLARPREAGHSKLNDLLLLLGSAG